MFPAFLQGIAALMTGPIGADAQQNAVASNVARAPSLTMPQERASTAMVI
jgi:hypothetical protein